MIRTADIEKLVALALATGHIKNEKPVSLLLVSQRPESGKTEIIKRFNGTSHIDMSNDISAFGIRRDLYSKISDGDIRHLVIPELLAPLSKKGSADSLIGALQTLMEDGTMNVHVGFTKEIKSDTSRSIGVIACIPRTQYQRHRMEWLLSGFLSRFLIISYCYNEETVVDIFDSIAKCEYINDQSAPLIFGDDDIDVNIPFELSKKCVELAKNITDEVRKQGSTYGFREAKILIRMVKAMALLDNRTEVIEDDYNEFTKLIYLINEQYNEVIR